MEVVSEKTGYPVETLEPSMDMESDLGIDSIKRVEILGAMQSLYLDLPKLKPEELAELRTLGQIVEHIGAKLGTHSVSTPSIIIPAVMAPPAPAVNSATVAVATSTVDLTALTQSLMEVVSEKTGYPVETLEPAMDMESDLGIDSIKRVEILGAMQSLYPDLPKLKPEELAELRTLGQIVEHIGAKLGTHAAGIPSVVMPTVVTPPAPAPVVSVAPVALLVLILRLLTQSLMEVVSEKTGYPVETLEPAMDMESDLGIDSIKRVEILGAMQSIYPDLPKLKPEELAELRTLGQIVEHIGAKLGTSTKSSVPVIAPAITTAPAPVSVNQPVSVAPSGIDLATLTATLMEVVSEKTGYPVETLEPAMDMESDLGIDSIKRVEILGAMQSLYPDLPKLKPEELAELRTLGQIVEHIGAKLGATSTNDAPVVVVSEATPVVPAPALIVTPPVISGVDFSALTMTLMEVVSEKTGYPVETLEPAMDMESDLGIDSIKRVEILGAMQSIYPDLPKLKPEELAELSTLGQIVEHIGEKLGAQPAAVIEETAAIVTPPVPEASRVGRSAVRLKALPLPGYPRSSSSRRIYRALDE